MPKPKDNDTAKELRAAVGNAIRVANAAYVAYDDAHVAVDNAKAAYAEYQKELENETMAE